MGVNGDVGGRAGRADQLKGVAAAAASGRTAPPPGSLGSRKSQVRARALSQNRRQSSFQFPPRVGQSLGISVGRSRSGSCDHQGRRWFRFQRARGPFSISVVLCCLRHRRRRTITLRAAVGLTMISLCGSGAVVVNPLLLPPPPPPLLPLRRVLTHSILRAVVSFGGPPRPPPAS